LLGSDGNQAADPPVVPLLKAVVRSALALGFRPRRAHPELARPRNQDHRLTLAVDVPATALRSLTLPARQTLLQLFQLFPPAPRPPPPTPPPVPARPPVPGETARTAVATASPPRPGVGELPRPRPAKAARPAAPSRCPRPGSAATEHASQPPAD